VSRPPAPSPTHGARVDDAERASVSVAQQLEVEESELYAGSNTLIAFFETVQRHKGGTKCVFRHGVLTVAAPERERGAAAAAADVDGGGGAALQHYIVDRCDADLHD
jgi:hypothetical protein